MLGEFVEVILKCVLKKKSLLLTNVWSNLADFLSSLMPNGHEMALNTQQNDHVNIQFKQWIEGKKNTNPNKLLLCGFYLPASISLLCWASMARVTPVHYTVKALNSFPTTPQRSPWGGFYYSPSPPDNTLPIMPLFNPIPPGIDTRGLERVWG